MAGTLFVVATPIGNLDDISARALRVLSEVSLIAAEDTRRTNHLLQRFGLTTRSTSFHEHNARSMDSVFSIDCRRAKASPLSRMLARLEFRTLARSWSRSRGTLASRSCPFRAPAR